MIRRITLALLLVASAIAPAQAASTSLAKFYDQILVWKKCEQRLECATFTVPLDYGKPSGRTISITAARNKATGTSRGNLVLNPGGPGGSGVDYILDAQYIVSPAIRRQFDLVSFDPRGVKRSTPLKCFTDKQTDTFLEVDQTPDTTAEQQVFVTRAKQLITACQQRDAELMRHLSAAEIARDMDVLRGLLGEDQLRFIGKSWGSTLGEVYAALFPQRVGLFVLDGAVDNKRSYVAGSQDQARAFETAAQRFIAWCAKQRNCALGRSESTARTTLLRFFKTLDAKPLKTQNAKRPLTEAQAWTAFIGPLYVRNGGWDWLNESLDAAISGKDGTALQEINDWFIERNARGQYTNNANTAIYAINCLDAFGAQTLQQARRERAATVKQMPILGQLFGWGDEACAAWPYRAQNPVQRLQVKNVPPMLILGTEYDPATPIQWARALQTQIPKSVLVELSGDGHTAYAVGSACMDRIVNAFLLSENVTTPVVPKNGTRCE